MNKAKHLSCLLTQLEAELKVIGLWSLERPSDQALASTEPFCIDTLAFEQWLQFIFIERMRMMISQEQPLPAALSLTPLAEEVYKQVSFNKQNLFKVLEAIDQLFR